MKHTLSRADLDGNLEGATWLRVQERGRNRCRDGATTSPKRKGREALASARVGDQTETKRRPCRCRTSSATSVEPEDANARVQVNRLCVISFRSLRTNRSLYHRNVQQHHLQNLRPTSNRVETLRICLRLAQSASPSHRKRHSFGRNFRGPGSTTRRTRSKRRMTAREETMARPREGMPQIALTRSPLRRPAAQTRS